MFSKATAVATSADADAVATGADADAVARRADDGAAAPPSPPSTPCGRMQKNAFACGSQKLSVSSVMESGRSTMWLSVQCNTSSLSTAVSFSRHVLYVFMDFEQYAPPPSLGAKYSHAGKFQP